MIVDADPMAVWLLQQSSILEAEVRAYSILFHLICILWAMNCKLHVQVFGAELYLTRRAILACHFTAAFLSNPSSSGT